MIIVSVSGSTDKDVVSEICISRKEVFELIGDVQIDRNQMFEKIETFISHKSERPYTLTESMKDELQRLLYKYRKKWEKHARNKIVFYQYNEAWLAESLVFPVPHRDDDLQNVEKKKIGRPFLRFEDSSERSKRRKSENLRSQASTDELCHATTMSLRASGKVDAANIVQTVTVGSPSKARKVRNSLEYVPETTYSKEEALSLLIEEHLSTNQYAGIRRRSKQQKCKLYPSYRLVALAKKACYPPKTEITITDWKAEVRLQALLDHTADRILVAQNEVLKTLTAEQCSKLSLICKWGCDGSSGHSEYKQTFVNSQGEQISDAHVFFTSVVPLQLTSVIDEGKENLIIWNNPRSSSPRFCRPLRLQFVQETTAETKKEIADFEKQASELVPFETIVGGVTISVSYKLALTMIDGKVCNAATDTTSTQRCYLCLSTSKHFNDIDTMLTNEVDENNLQFGMSTLHAWIRFFECCLHVAYKLECKAWQARSAEDKESVKKRQANIQSGFRSRMGLIIDKPKHGYGNTNDGNTARKFFEKTEESALITGIDKTLIERFHVILQTMSCGHAVNVVNFEKYAIDTARLFVELYPWYYMPTTVHKVLIHGSLIISKALLPIGRMSEEAQEASNKFIKRFRLDFSRKSSRQKTITDVFLRLLVHSDPLISSVRTLPKKKLHHLLPQTMEMLLAPEAPSSRGSKRRDEIYPDAHTSSNTSCSESDSTIDGNYSDVSDNFEY